jgi:Tfp pilus assembly protein PilF
LNEAEEMARKACQREPANPTFLDTFAWVLYQQGKYGEAKAIMELALENGGDKEAVLLEHYGDILWKSNEKERALEYWKQAQTLDEKACSEFLNEKIKTQTLIEN